ncbi:MAG: hypothetical protein WCI73_02180 [Phycisphaerae bacterium]
MIPQGGTRGGEGVGVFSNTFRWLAEPSLASSTLGGYVQKPERLEEFKPKTNILTAADLLFPMERGKAWDPNELERPALSEGTTVEDLLSRRLGELPTWHGLIGARSSLSGGADPPADMIAAARTAGLDYIVFLEDFTKMTPAKLEELKKLCAAACDDKFQAYHGLEIADNRGHTQQKNLVLEVTDLNGRQAISGEQFDRNQLNYHFWCSDRENGDLYHGPFNNIMKTETGPWYPGKGIDTNSTIGVPFGFNHPKLDTDQGQEGERYFNHRPCQTLVSEDARIFRSVCFKKYPESEKLWMVWGTYGPLIDTDLFTFTQEALTYRVGWQYFPQPETPAAPDIAWVAPSLLTGRVEFKRDVTVKELQLLGFGGPWDMYKIPDNQVFLAAAHTREDVTVCGEYKGFPPPGKHSLSGPYTILPNGFMAMYSSRPAGAGVVYNLGEPLIFDRGWHGLTLDADVAGRTFKKGETYEYRWLTLNGRADDKNSLQRYDEIRKFLGMTAERKPGYDLQLKTGKLVSARGLLDIAADNGLVDLAIPAPEAKLHVIIGARISGLNSRWSAGLFDRSRGKYRPLGTHENTGYVRLNPETGESKDIMLGHPVVADNKEVFITCTHLSDQPSRWQVNVQNPTAAPLTVKLTRRMALPGLDLVEKTVEVPAGDDMVVAPSAAGN